MIGSTFVQIEIKFDHIDNLKFNYEKIMRKTARAFAATKYSVLALRPAAPPAERSYDAWYHWDGWARKMGILDKHGNPSLSKVKMLIKHHRIAATKSKCGYTFHRYDPITGEPIFRRVSRIVVTERCIEQEDWTPEDWQAEYKFLFGRSQANKAKGKRRKRA